MGVCNAFMEEVEEEEAREHISPSVCVRVCVSECLHTCVCVCVCVTGLQSMSALYIVQAYLTHSESVLISSLLLSSALSFSLPPPSSLLPSSSLLLLSPLALYQNQQITSFRLSTLHFFFFFFFCVQPPLAHIVKNSDSRCECEPLRGNTGLYITVKRRKPFIEHF